MLFNSSPFAVLFRENHKFCKSINPAMKRIIFLFAFIGLFLIPAVAQQDRSSGTDTASVNSMVQKPLIIKPAPESGFHFHPGDSLRYRKIPRYRLPKQYPDSLLPQQFLAEKRSPVDNMPIAGSPGYYYPRMPIYKPDSTIDYKLKIKKIQRFTTPRIKP